MGRGVWRHPTDDELVEVSDELPEGYRLLLIGKRCFARRAWWERAPLAERRATLLAAAGEGIAPADCIVTARFSLEGGWLPELQERLRAYALTLLPLALVAALALLLFSAPIVTALPRWAPGPPPIRPACNIAVEMVARQAVGVCFSFDDYQ